ncbi:hypothetical protein [Occultella glacieicola]|nr:hypothetical protein [Occultella glacieicola]
MLASLAPVDAVPALGYRPLLVLVLVGPTHALVRRAIWGRPRSADEAT